jgi:hypothetical protein
MVKEALQQTSYECDPPTPTPHPTPTTTTDLITGWYLTIMVR